MTLPRTSFKATPELRAIHLLDRDEIRRLIADECMAVNVEDTFTISRK
jgi:hypothetical protein